MAVLKAKFKEVILAVFPVMLIVVLLHLTIVPLRGHLLPSFLLGGMLIVFGLTIFLFGVEQSIDRMGQDIGSLIAHSGKHSAVVICGLCLGFLISFAEPDLHILAGQIDTVTSGQFAKLLLVFVVSLGIAVMLTLGLLRILKSVKLNRTFLMAYGLIFVLGAFSSPDFLAIAFDSSGATTGALTTPFILALAIGVSAMKKNAKASEVDSFGLVGVASTGAILAVLITGRLLGVTRLTGIFDAAVLPAENGVLAVYLHTVPHIAWETLFSLAPIALVYTFFQAAFLKKNKASFLRICKGLLLTLLGLILFLTGVNGGFMHVGREVGMRLAALDNKLPLLVIALLLGLVTVLAEPAVIVLTHQVEEITGGYVKRPLVLIFLSLAVGLAIFMAVLRILVPQIKLWMLLLIGFGGAVILSFLVPGLFVGIGFDAGGVASGPMTATFTLAFVQGVAIRTPAADIVRDGFGMIAVVAMMPIVAIELLGLIYRIQTRKMKEQKHV